LQNDNTGPSSQSECYKPQDLPKIPERSDTSKQAPQSTLKYRPGMNFEPGKKFSAAMSDTRIIEDAGD